MGIFDSLKKKAIKAVDEHGDQIAKGIDKAADLADTKTHGQHSGQLDKASGAAKDGLDKLDGRNDDIPPASPQVQPPAR
ncbi:MAG: antitoxin [Sporichthyaceae bacterium]